MATLVVPNQPRGGPGPRTERLSTEVRVGKDVLELVSSGMYVEPLSVVREYIQNAADSVDAAYEAGLLGPGNHGRIDVITDEAARELRIVDNGTGLDKSRAESVLAAIGASSKRSTAARGFRGVGRLGGLGFAQRVVFRTRAPGESKITEVEWDCGALKALLLDPHAQLDLQDLVRQIVGVRGYVLRDAPSHFFEVRLQGIVRLRNDRLLNDAILRSYLQQVAPLRMHAGLPFADEIEALLADHRPRRPIDVFLNGGGPLCRPHRREFSLTATKKDRFSEMQLLRLQGVDGSLAAVGWVLHHGYMGALQAAPEIRGLRARIGDMQVGDESLFAEVFPERRFNAWVVGELHVLDPRVLPNGRRDGFEASASYSNLVGQLVPLGRELARRCRTSSRIRARVKSFELLEHEVDQALTLIRRRRMTSGAIRRLVSSSVQAAGRMEKIAGLGLLPHPTQADLRRRATRARDSLERATKLARRAKDPLQLLPPAKRAAYGEFLGVLYECVKSKRVADQLIQRITRRLANLGGRLESRIALKRPPRRKGQGVA